MASQNAQREPIGNGAGQGTDLFGHDPDASPLAYYSPLDTASDIYSAASDSVGEGWRAFAAGLSAQGQGDLTQVQAYLNRHVEDLGLAFRMTGDENERPWPLGPMPILIGGQEWDGVEQGLVQRAELLEAVIADIYGPQELVRMGHIPAAIISGSSHFARRMVGMKPSGGHFLHVVAFDLARDPDGNWRILADRVRLPVGIGYALENRLALGRATGALLASIGTRRQADFFDSLRLGIAARCKRGDPRIALLTPGRFNQAYPEQAHLARHLGFSLVEGRDLTVRGDKLYVRTIAGRKRIDAVWRWIGTRDIDPLNFDSRSQIGVPNLVSACADGLVVANWLGAGVVESRAMPAFMPQLAQSVLGEVLKLPNAATWWCGGESERSHVLANLDTMVLSSAFREPIAGLPDGHSRPGAEINGEERHALLEGLSRRPMDYTAQEIVSLSTTPALHEGRFEPRAFTLRAFLARNEQGEWVALPGGFARLSQQGDLRTSLMGMGDISADVCIVDDGPHAKSAMPPVFEPPAIRREQGLLPSQAADNLYWIGRYGERGHQTTRVIRVMLDQISGAGAETDAGTATARLAGLLRRWGAAPQESIAWQPTRIAATALADRAQPGSVLALARAGRQIALLLRDRLTQDSWRVIQRHVPQFEPGDADSMSAACDELVERFAALARLTADGMSRSHAWRFLDMGICLEHASMILQAAQAMVPGSASGEDLAALLELVDGQSLYRSRYLAMPYIAPVLDMVLLDPAQPRGFAFQLQRIEDHLSAMPILRTDGMMEPPLAHARQLQARIEGLRAEELDAPTLEEIRLSLAELSNAIGNRYFLQEEVPMAGVATTFLA